LAEFRPSGKGKGAFCFFAISCVAPDETEYHTVNIELAAIGRQLHCQFVIYNQIFHTIVSQAACYLCLPWPWFQISNIRAYTTHPVVHDVRGAITTAAHVARADI
jgi:hypothetical protein